MLESFFPIANHIVQNFLMGNLYFYCWNEKKGVTKQVQYGLKYIKSVYI